MIEVKVELEKFKKKLEGKFDSVWREVDKTLEEGAINITNMADSSAPIHDSELVNSIDYSQFERSENSIIYKVSASAPHASIVEFGTRPFFPRVSSPDFRKWVKDKLKPSDEDLDSVAFLVGRSISRNGIKAQPFLRPAYFFYENKIRDDVKKAIRKGLSKK